MGKADELRAVSSAYSQKLDAIVSSHAAFLEAGYNYLASARDGDADIETKKKEFEDVLRSDIAKRGVTVAGDNEFAQLARDVLQKISDQFDIPMVGKPR